MSFPRRLTGAAALCLWAAAAQAQTPEACATRDRCLDAVMDAAAGGRQLEEMAMMRLLPRVYGTRPSAPGTTPPDTRSDGSLAVGEPDAILETLQRDQNWLNLPASERQRTLAQAYLEAGRPAQAELELDEAIANQPSYAPYWLDLAQVYAHQGRRDKAAAALVVATDWTADAAALQQTYAQAAQRSNKGSSGSSGSTASANEVPYAQALQLLAARTAALAQREAALAPRPLTKGPDGKYGEMPIMLFNSCPRPDYPRASLRNEETGTVTLQFLVDSAGKPVQIRKTRSSGHAGLDNATLLSLSACSFKPLAVDGKPAAAWATVQYVWTLE